MSTCVRNLNINWIIYTINILQNVIERKQIYAIEKTTSKFFNKIIIIKKFSSYKKN